ncbi:hypothetical protein AB9_016 [Acinetobacter phage vB_AbaM_B9]|nr:hypothetical protein AB9_016 [Acinetobacter phage vB_AbaM_B9]
MEKEIVVDERMAFNNGRNYDDINTILISNWYNSKWKRQRKNNTVCFRSKLNWLY